MRHLSLSIRAVLALAAPAALSGCAAYYSTGAAPPLATTAEVAALLPLPEPPESDDLAARGDALRARAASLRTGP